jgi:chromosome segregation ATPase
VKLYRKFEQLELYYKDEQTRFHDYKSQIEKEGIDCVKLAQRAEERAQELKTQLTAKTNEFETTQEVLRKLRREYQATRQDAEGMLQVMSGLERQVANYVSKEDEFHKLTRECKDKVEEAVSFREQVLLGALLVLVISVISNRC